MTHTRLRLDLPDGSWLAALSRVFPESTIRLSGAIDGDESDALVTLAASDRGLGPSSIPDDEGRGREDDCDADPADDRLAALGRRFSAADVDVESVKRVADEPSPLRGLTDAQRDLLLEAVDAGYFDTPRECTLTELADRCDIAPSTASETLRRAERCVVTRFTDRLAAEPNDDTNDR